MCYYITTLLNFLQYKSHGLNPELNYTNMTMQLCAILTNILSKNTHVSTCAECMLIA